MILQAFEHQKIRIGKSLSSLQWQALVAFAQQNTLRYYTILHDGIQLNNFVGTLQVGDLTIEILPKIDEASDAPVQTMLLDMLRECRFLQPESASSSILQERGGSLLAIYINQFLNKVEQLLREGLTRAYFLETANRPTLKGKLLINKQIEKNFAHPERFFTEVAAFSEQHPFNRLIYSALLALQQMSLSAALTTHLQQLLAWFPAVEPWDKPLPDWEKLRFDRQTLRYKIPLQTAMLILKQTQPDVRAGRLPVLAILFDMNVLFEEFIFRQLQKTATSQHIIVKRQVPKPFWNRRPIQPDILLSIDNQNIVIDTKWKKLQKVSPAMEDLRQMFVYNQYFNARHSVLVYPWMRGLEDLQPVPFQPTKENDEPYFCQVRLVELSKNGQLNRHVGAELLERILIFQ